MSSLDGIALLEKTWASCTTMSHWHEPSASVSHEAIELHFLVIVLELPDQSTPKKVFVSLRTKGLVLLVVKEGSIGLCTMATLPVVSIFARREQEVPLLYGIVPSVTTEGHVPTQWRYRSGAEVNFFAPRYWAVACVVRSSEYCACVAEKFDGTRRTQTQKFRLHFTYHEDPPFTTRAPFTACDASNFCKRVRCSAGA